jgi:hypothetical protein
LSPKFNNGIRGLFLRVLLVVTPLVVIPNAAICAREHARVGHRAVRAGGSRTHGGSFFRRDRRRERTRPGVPRSTVRGSDRDRDESLHIDDHRLLATVNGKAAVGVRPAHPRPCLSRARRPWAWERRELATLFSNESETHRSSLGLFVTEGTYFRKNGYSIRLNGLEAGVNDRALERTIVMRGAPYVSSEFADAQGRPGRSWGCTALRDSSAREAIDRIKGGGLVFAYYPTTSGSSRPGTWAAARPRISP